MAKHAYDADAHRHDFTINRNLGNATFFHFVSRIEQNYVQGESISLIIKGLTPSVTTQKYDNCTFKTTQGIYATTGVFTTGTICDFYVNLNESPALVCIIHAQISTPANTSLIQFMGNAYGAYDVPGPMVAVQGQNIVLPAGPKHNSYKFTGWKDAINLYDAGDEYLVPNSNVTLWAQWGSGQTVTIDYNNNYSNYSFLRETDSFANMPEPQSVLIGTSVKLSTLVPTVPGATFLAWTTSDGLYTYQPGDTVNLRTNLTLYAKWKVHQYYIKYTNGNSVIESRTVNYRDSITSLKTLTPASDPSGAGRQFAGWSYNGQVLNPSALNPWVIPAQPGNGADIPLIAQWGEIVYYTIRGNSSPASGGMVIINGTGPLGQYVYGTEIQLEAYPYNGYDFASWGDGNTSNPLTVTVTKNATYTALFESASYTLNYTSNYGDAPTSVTSSNPQMTVAEPTASMKSSSGASQKVFRGWKVNGQGALIEPHSGITLTSDSVTLVASYTSPDYILEQEIDTQLIVQDAWASEYEDTSEYYNPTGNISAAYNATGLVVGITQAASVGDYAIYALDTNQEINQAYVMIVATQSGGGDTPEYVTVPFCYEYFPSYQTPIQLYNSTEVVFKDGNPNVIATNTRGYLVLSTTPGASITSSNNWAKYQVVEDGNTTIYTILALPFDTEYVHTHTSETHTFSDHNYINAYMLTEHDVVDSITITFDGAFVCTTSMETQSNLIPIGETDLVQLTYTSGIDRLTKYVNFIVESTVLFGSEYGTAPSKITGVEPGQSITLPQATSSMVTEASSDDLTFVGWLDSTSSTPKAPGSSVTPFSDIFYSTYLYNA